MNMVRYGVGMIVDRLKDRQSAQTDGEVEGARAAILASFGKTNMDRPISASDLWAIRSHAAVRFHTTFFKGRAYADQDLVHTAVEFACHDWMDAKLSGALFWPEAELGSAAFAYNLFRQMSAHAANPQAAAFSALSLLVAEVALADVDPEASIARAAFFAGLAFGQLGEQRAEQVTALVLSELQRVHETRATGQGKRLEKIAEAKAAEDAELFELAATMLREDPALPSSAIQRRWRRMKGLTLETTSNAQSQKVSRWRRDGLFDAR